MRYLRYGFLGLLGIVLITVAIANRGVVTLTLLPAELGALFGLNLSIQIPLFVVIFSGIVAGLFIGFCWEWLREYIVFQISVLVTFSWAMGIPGCYPPFAGMYETCI